MDLSRRLAASSEAGPLILGPVLAAVGSAVVLSFLGLDALLPLSLLIALAVAVGMGLWRFDLWYTAFLVYLLFETVAADFLPGSLGLISKDLIYLAVVGLGVLTLAARPLPERARPPAVAVTAVLLLVGFHLWLVLRGPTLLLGALGFRGTVFLALTALLAPLAYREERGRHFSLALLGLGLVVVAVVAFWEAYAWQQVREVLELEQQRWSMGTLKASSTVGSPGALGAVMGVGLLFLVARLLEGGMRRRWWIVLAVVGGLWMGGLVLSFSRISQISFALLALLLLLRRPRLFVPGVALLAVAAVIADWATHGFFSGNLLATFGLGEHLDAIQSTQDRVQIIHDVLDRYWPMRPWMGFGLGSAGAATLVHLQDAPLGYLFLDNMYLKALVEGGIVGFLVHLLSIAVPLGAAGVLELRLRGRMVPPWRRAMLRGAGATVLFYALVGTASTVHEMPVVNVSLWWAIGWLVTEAAWQREEDLGEGVQRQRSGPSIPDGPPR